MDFLWHHWYNSIKFLLTNKVRFNDAVFAAGISVPTVVDYVPQCISHRAERSLGTGSTSTSDSSLTCVTKWSGFTGPEEGDSKSVWCDTDYVMTSCYSFHKVSGPFFFPNVPGYIVCSGSEWFSLQQKENRELRAFFFFFWSACLARKVLCRSFYVYIFIHSSFK